MRLTDVVPTGKKHVYGKSTETEPLLFGIATSPEEDGASWAVTGASDSTAAVPVSQEMDMRSPYKPRPLLPVTGVHAGGPTRGVRTNQGVHTGNICVNSREFT